MALIVGRAGADLSLPLPSPTTIDRDGDRVRFRGNLWSETTDAADASPALGRVLRDQVVGLDPSNSPGAPVRPVIYTPGEIARFGRVLSASCGTSKAAEANGVWPYDIEVEWVTSSHAPLVEERVFARLRTQPDGTANAHSIAEGDTHFAHSPGGGIFGYDRILPADSSFSRTGADGLLPIALSDPPTNGSVRWYVAPGDFYDGSVGIARTIDGATPLLNQTYKVVGREMPNFPGGWVMFNSLCAVIGSATANVVEFTMLWHDGTAYESSKTFRITSDSSWTDSGVQARQVRVIRNTPEACTLRVRMAGAGVSFDQANLDITLRRGAPYAEFLFTSSSLAWGVKLSGSTEALTSLTGGARATNNDASGNKLLLASPQGITLDATNGRMRLTSAATKFAFMVGTAIAGGVGTGDGQTQSVVYEYFAAASGTQRLVIP